MNDYSNLVRYENKQCLWSKPLGETVTPQTKYKADRVLRGLQRYHKVNTIRVRRRSDRSGYTKWNPYEGKGWLSYEPEYEKLNNKLRAFYDDGSSSLVQVVFANGDAGPRGYSAASVQRNTVTLTYQGMPFDIWSTFWWHKKGEQEPIPIGYQNFFGPGVVHANSDASQIYDTFGASHTMSLTNLLPPDAFFFGGTCDQFVREHTMYVRMFGYSFFFDTNSTYQDKMFDEGENTCSTEAPCKRIFQTTGWGNFTEIVPGNDPCGGTPLFAENNSLMTIEVDKNDLGDDPIGPGEAEVRIIIKDATVRWLLRVTGFRVPYDYSFNPHTFIEQGFGNFTKTFTPSWTLDATPTPYHYDFEVIALTKECAFVEWDENDGILCWEDSLQTRVIVYEAQYGYLYGGNYNDTNCNSGDNYILCVNEVQMKKTPYSPPPPPAIPPPLSPPSLPPPPPEPPEHP